MNRIFRRDLGSGAATAFKPEIIYVNVDDILSCPEPASGEVVIEEDIVLKPGAKASSFYVTAKSLKIMTDTTGDIDGEGYEVKGEATMPGDNEITKKLKKFALKGNFLVLFKTCKGGEFELMGSCCNPIRLKFSTEKDNEKTITKVMFERPINTDEDNTIYRGSVSFVEPFEFDSAALALNKDNGSQFVVKDTVTGPLTIDSNNFETGNNVTFIGSGGSSPATLATGSTVFLKDGQMWESLEGSSITFRVINDGTNLILFELNRS